MTVQELLSLTEVYWYTSLDLYIKDRTPRIVCMDGTSLSVQASEHNYCIPQDNSGPYIQVEVGFPSRKFDELMPYIDGDSTTDPTATVYGYVPIDLVEKIVADCGGICEEITYLAKGSEAYR